MSECSRKLWAENKHAPRTCPICKMGPCRGGLNGRPWEPTYVELPDKGAALSECRNRRANATGQYAKSCRVCGHSRTCPEGVVWEGGGGASEMVTPVRLATVAEVRVITESGVADAAANYLWSILDDIDTVDDMVKDGPKADAGFRRMVMALVEKRWKVASINNAEDPVLEWKAPPPEDEQKPS
jgi:hypothetical protein